MDYQDGCQSIALILALISAPASAADGPKFSLPIQCSDQIPCFLQNMVDIDESANRRDPYCGLATFNGHKGTDIRVRDIKTLQQNLPVLAMKEGVVTAIRDGMGDKILRSKSDFNGIKGRECGNGVVINHGTINGTKWETQTCHLAKGSVVVKKGARVTAGQKIALMGLSGKTQFPHVHVTIRANGKVIDPITGLTVGESCNISSKTPLFSVNALSKLQKMKTHFLQSGFSNGPVKGSDLLQGTVQKPTKKGPLVFYAKLINLHAGDKIRLTIDGPNGLFATRETKPFEKPKATFTVFAGKRGKLESGTYSGKVEILRNGTVVTSNYTSKITF